ncbi:hypothetical protein C0991_002908, partial [Blastosporella zonata]
TDLEYQDPNMIGAYTGLPHIEHCLVLEPTGYDALIDCGSAQYASVSIMAPLMKAGELK